MKSKYHAKNARYCVINVKVVRSHVIGCHARRLRGRDYNGCNSWKVGKENRQGAILIDSKTLKVFIGKFQFYPLYVIDT